MVTTTRILHFEETSIFHHISIGLGQKKISPVSHPRITREPGSPDDLGKALQRGRHAESRVDLQG
jgi:hypothetical protein